MITNQVTFSASRQQAACCGGCRDKEEAGPGESFTPTQPRIGFEPWIGPGKPGHPEPAICPRPQPLPEVCPEPVVGFEPWLSGQPTHDPSVSPKFADKLVRAFGEQALLSINDERIKGCEGYYFQGWESVGGDDFIQGVTLGRLGEGWQMVEYGTYELKTGGVGQRLTFDMANRQTVLESYYDEQRFETSRFSEILRRDEDGSMRRETPPVGL
ncbi:MAG: hypothetical protein AB1758_19570 [Candidatus Eremiobacterota bacterium]